MFKRTSRFFTLSAGTIALLPFSTRLSYADGAGVGHHGWGGGWGDMMFGSSMMTIGTVLTIVLIALAIRGIGGRSGSTENELSTHSAHDVLGERFARGDIDKDEFEARKQLLSN